MFKVTSNHRIGIEVTFKYRTHLFIFGSSSVKVKTLQSIVGNGNKKLHPMIQTI